MQIDFNILETTRNNVKGIVSQFSIEELNTIPAGFNNNLIWNFGHIIVTQQLLCYKLSNQEMITNNDLVNKYRKGSKPSETTPVSQEEFDSLMKLMEHSTKKIQKDYAEGIFKEYKTYTTSYNMTLTSIEEAIRFNNVHESMHLGQCIFLKKFV